MSHFVLNFLHRWRWVFVCGISLQLLLILSHGGQMDGIQLRAAMFFSIIPFQLPVYLDLERRVPRILTTLPMTSRDIARSYFFLSVLVPAAITVIITFVGFLASAICGKRMITMDNFLLAITAQVALTSAFCSLLLHPASDSCVRQSNGLLMACNFLMQRFFRLFATYCGMLLLFIPLSWKDVSILHLSFFALLLLVSAHTLFRSDSITSLQSNKRPITTYSRKQTLCHIPAPRGRSPGGFLQIVISNATQSLIIPTCIIVFLAPVLGFYYSTEFSAITDPNNLDSITELLLVVSLLAFLCSLGSIRWLESLRVWRILPITDHRLALLLICLPMTPFIILTCLTVLPFACYGHWQKVDILCKGMIQLGAILIVIAPATMNLESSDQDASTRILTILCIIPVVILFLYIMQVLVGWPGTLLAVALLAPLAFAWTLHLLRNHSECYRNCIVPTESGPQ